MGDWVNSDHTTPLPIVNRSQSNTTLYIDVLSIDLRKLLYVNVKSGEIFTRWFIFRGGSLVGVNVRRYTGRLNRLSLRLPFQIFS